MSQGLRGSSDCVTAGVGRRCRRVVERDGVGGVDRCACGRLVCCVGVADGCDVCYVLDTVRVLFALGLTGWFVRKVCGGEALYHGGVCHDGCENAALGNVGRLAGR